MEKKYLSIIVPVYNVEKYLQDCFESLEKQIEDNIEIIFVDDGSPDNSGKLCDQYAKNHNNAFVIHKTNGGLSDARNAGIQAANGKYVMFLDSDDALVDNICTKLITILQLEEVDILYAVIKWITPKKTSLYTKFGVATNEIISGIDALKMELSAGKFAAMAQMGIYRTEFIRGKSLWFKNGILHEDEQWTPRVMIEAKKIRKIDIPFYKYYIRENSITQNKSIKRYYDLIDTVNEIDSLYKDRGDMTLRKYGSQYLVKLYMHAVAHIKNCGRKCSTRIGYIFKNSYGLRNYLRCGLFLVSPKLYLRIVEKEKY